MATNLALVNIDTGDVGTEFGEAGTGDEAHVTGADHYYVHMLFISIVSKRQKFFATETHGITRKKSKTRKQFYIYTPFRGEGI